MRNSKYRLNPVYFCMIAGFLAGIIVPNIFWREIYAQAGIVSGYMMECLADIEEECSILFEEVQKKRLGMSILLTVCGMSVFGVPVSCVVSGILGFELGSIMTVSILQFGVQGGILGLGLLFPQHMLYIPAFLSIGMLSYKKSMELWHGGSIFHRRLWKYLGIALVYLIVIFIGGCLETYCTPEIMKNLLKNLKIF